MDFTKKYNEHINNLDKFKKKQIQLSNEMSNAYDYKEDLISKMQFADKEIKSKQNEYHTMLMQIQTEISKLKIEFDLHMAEL